MPIAMGADVIEQGKRYEAYGVTWDEVAKRKLVTGEYVRILLEQYGARLLMQFGGLKSDDQKRIEWLWEVPLVAADAAAIVGMVAFGQAHVAANVAGFVEQTRLNQADLEAKLVATATELRNLKDGVTGDAASQGNES